MELHEYAFDVKLFAVVRVTATSEDEARKWIKENLDGASANLGMYEGGDPIITEVSLDDIANDECFEIDGEST